MKKYESIHHDEYESVRSSSAFVDLSFRGKLKLSGKDRFTYLDRMVTNRVVDLKEGNGVYALLLDLKGRVVADMRIYSLESFLWIELDESRVEKLEQILTNHRFIADVPIKNITEDWALFSVQGPSSENILSDFFQSSLSSLGNLQGIGLTWNSNNVFVVCVDRTGSGGYDLFTQKDRSHELSEALRKKIPTFGLDTLELLRVESGIPRYGRDFDETVLALDTPLKDTAIHYQKGCYMGQEVITRIHSRGKINRSMKGLVFSENNIQDNVQGEAPNQAPIQVQKDDPVYQGEKQVGRITSSSFSPQLKKNIALANLRKNSQNSEEPFFIYTNNELKNNEAKKNKIEQNETENETKKERILAKLVDLPFYSSSLASSSPSFPH